MTASESVARLELLMTSQSRPQFPTSLSLGLRGFAMTSPPNHECPSNLGGGIPARPVFRCCATRGVLGACSEYLTAPRVFHDDLFTANCGKYPSSDFAYGRQFGTKRVRHFCSEGRYFCRWNGSDANYPHEVARFNVARDYRFGPSHNGFVKPTSPLTCSTPCRWCGQSPTWCPCGAQRDEVRA